MNPYESPRHVVDDDRERRPDGKHCPACHASISFWRPTRFLGEMIRIPPRIRLGVHCPRCRAVLHYARSRGVVALSAVNVLLFASASSFALLAHRPYAWQVILVGLAGFFVPVQIAAHWYLRNYKVLKPGLSARAEAK